MNKIAVIITFFGKFPKYIDYFIHSCAYNKNIDFIFFTDDIKYQNDNYKNIKFYPFTLNEFNLLATKKIGVRVNLTKGYKLCDLRPMYGLIYEDYLTEYTFWGYCDTDMIFGDMESIFTNDLLSNYDILSSHDQYMSGPFSLYRNIPEVNELFKKSKDYKRVIQDNKNLSFDEASNVIKHLWHGHNIFDFESEVESMTHLVKNPKKHKLRPIFTGYINERVQGNISWKNGKLYNNKGTELYIFHYIVYKNKISFNIPSYRGDDFYFTKHGFFHNNIKSIYIDWPISYTNNFLNKVKSKIRKAIKI